MRVIKADDIMAHQRSFALRAYQFGGTDVIAVLWRVGARVTAFHYRECRPLARLFKLSHQHAAALMRISLFPMLPQLFEKRFPNFQRQAYSAPSLRSALFPELFTQILIA